VHLVTGLGVAAFPRLALAEAEAAEAAQLDLLAAMERLDDAAKDGVDDDLGMLLRQIRDARHLFHQLRLRHAAVGHAASLEGLSVPEVIADRGRPVAGALLVLLPVRADLVRPKRADRQADLAPRRRELDDLHRIRLADRQLALVLARRIVE